jgi:hypothetical protein
MTQFSVDPEIRAAASDHLVKALLAVLAVKEPELVDRVRDMFLIATAYDSRVAPDREAVWAEIEAELQAVEELVKGSDDGEAEADGDGSDGRLADGAADGWLKTGT